MGMSPELAAKIANAKTSKKGTPVNAGRYTFIIKRILCEKLFGGYFFIPEFEVEDCEKVFADIEPNPIGSGCSCAWGLEEAGKKGEAMLGNIKKFTCALLGLDLKTPPDQIMAEAMKWAGAANDPDSLRARGMRICAETVRSTIQSGKNAGKDADFPEFQHVSAAEGNSPEEIAKRRAELDAAKK